MIRTNALAIALGTLLMAAAASAAPVTPHEMQAPRGEHPQAPRGEDVQAPRGEDTQAPRGEDAQASRGNEDVQTARGHQEVHAPRGEDVQAPGV